MDKEITGVGQSFKALLFALGNIDFAIQLSKVTEIIRMTEIRKVPRVPIFVEGVIHLRGRIIIIVNLRKLFMIKGKPSKNSKIIIFSIDEKQIGFIVDDVSKIVQKNSKDILPPPPVVIKGPVPDCIFGVIDESDKNILLLDLTRSFSALEEIGLNQALERELSFLVDQIND